MKTGNCFGESCHLFVFYMKTNVGGWRENKRETSQLPRFFWSRNGAAGFKGIWVPLQPGDCDWTRSSSSKHHFLHFIPS